MLVDQHGNELPDRKPEPHKFGSFKLPPDCHIKGFGGITSEEEWRETPTGQGKDYTKRRATYDKRAGSGLPSF